IVFQFTISLLFIIASIVIGSQLRYALRADLGFRTDAIVTLNRPRHNVPGGTALQSDKARQRAGVQTGEIAALADKIRQLAGVVQVIRESRPPLASEQVHSGFTDGGLKGSNEKFNISLHYGNEDYLPFYGMKLIAGRNLLPSDSARELLI